MQKLPPRCATSLPDDSTTYNTPSIEANTTISLVAPACGIAHRVTPQPLTG